jgi:hypothetical protein
MGQKSIEHFDEALQLNLNDSNGRVSESLRSKAVAGQSCYDKALTGFQRGSSRVMAAYGHHLNAGSHRQVGECGGSVFESV